MTVLIPLIYDLYMYINPGNRENVKTGKRETGKPGKRETGKPGSRETGKPGKRDVDCPDFTTFCSDFRFPDFPTSRLSDYTTF